MTFTHALSTNNYGPSKFIVTSSSANGTHTTIASALTAASSGDTIFIRPGTYTENLTLKAGVNLTAYESDSSLNGSGSVIISGTCTFTAAGSVSISGIQLQTNSAALLAVTGSSASIVNLIHCYLNCTNNTGITFSSSSSSAQINIRGSSGELGTTGIAYFAHSSAGTLEIRFGHFMNSGNSTTNNTVSAGLLTIYSTNFRSPITTSGTGDINLNYVTMNMGTENVTCLTHGGSGSAYRQVSYCRFITGSASAVSISTTLSVNYTEINCDNANAITGTGTLIYAGNYFAGTSSGLNSTLTFNPLIETSGVVYWVSTRGTTPADSTTYYLLQTSTNLAAASSSQTRVVINKTGTIKAVYGGFSCTTGSAENVTMAIRVNNTTNYNVSTTVQMNASPGTFSNAAMSGYVVAGDFIDFVMVTPAWVTNPTNVIVNMSVLIE